jgi:hypothetical protein
LRFEEDGAGGADWTVERASRLNGDVLCDDAKDEAAGRNDERGRQAAVRASLERYVETAKAFMACAQKNDLEGMLASTSVITIAESGGADATKKIYSERLVRHVSKAVIEWNDTHDLMTAADTGNTGVEVGCSVKGDNSYPLYVWVIKEGGKYVVTSASVKPYADLLKNAE